MTPRTYTQADLDQAVRDAQAVTVKPLEVEERRSHRLGLGDYEVAPNGPDIDGNQYWRVRFHGKVICKKIKGVERAVRWVQKHHEQTVLRQITATPARAVEAEAYERAAEAIEPHPKADVKTGGVLYRAQQAIRALITTDHAEALEAVRREAREEGFWMGRKAGGSIDQIESALTAIREGKDDG